MTIPFDIRIFSLIYESGKYLLPLLFVLWLIWLICVAILRLRKQFLFTSAVFLLLCLFSTAFTWCGWYYRMKLREKYAVVRQGAQEKEGAAKKVYNINLMPPEIRQEYDKDGGRPRFRGVKAQALLSAFMVPVTLLGQLILYSLFFRRPKSTENGSAVPHK